MSSSLLYPIAAADPRAFADAAARLAGSVAIIAWEGASGPEGLLVRTVSLLSTRPPRVLFGVEKDALGHAGLLQTEACAINLLSDADEDEAERYVREELRDERFSPTRWRLQDGRAPRLQASAAHLTGVIDQRIDAGSHSLFVLRVEDVDARDQSPLVYFNRGFRRLEPPRQTSGAQVCAILEA
jgi:flavin reductase (DIM6/NTAB) family NADH-FMN oxidoreductase RutF